MTTVEPVESWEDDFEIFDPEFVNDPYPIWKDLRESGCPFARTERRQVSYLPVTFDGVQEQQLRGVELVECTCLPTNFSTSMTRRSTTAGVRTECGVCSMRTRVRRRTHC